MYGYLKGPTTTQSVSVTGGAAFKAKSSARWLDVAPSGKAPGSLSWHVDPTGLKAGSYHGRITIGSRIGAVATLAVDFSVGPRAKVRVSPSALMFSENAINGKGAPISPTCDATVWNDELKNISSLNGTGDTTPADPGSLQTLTIANGGARGSVLHYQAFLVVPTASWLTTDLNPTGNKAGFQTSPGQPLIPTGGAIAAGQTNPLKIASIADANAITGYALMNQGTYKGTVQIRDLADPSKLVTVPATLVLGSGQGTPTMVATPASISVSLPPGSSTDDNLVLSDSSQTCGYAYSLDTGAPWVQANPFLQSGYVPVPAAAAAPAATDSGSGNGFVPLTISAAGLAPGTYATQITVNSQNAVTNPTIVPVTLHVTGATPKPKPKHRRHHRS
jgi:hypothetical protein